MNRLSSVISSAHGRLSPRAQYARAVVSGQQRWSGADLRGKAARYGARYAQQRNMARIALHDAGGAIVAGPRGLLSTAVRIGVDDFGTAVYDTVEWGIVSAEFLR